MHVLAGPWPARADLGAAPAAARARRSATRSASTASRWRAPARCWRGPPGRACSWPWCCRRTVSLTALRIAAPAALAAANWAALAGDPGPTDARRRRRRGGGRRRRLLARSPATCSSTARPTATSARLPLRVPTALVLGPVPLAWLAAVVAGPIAGPLLLAARAVGRRRGRARRRAAARRGRGASAARARSTVGGASCRPGWCCTTTTRWSSRCCSRDGRSDGSDRPPPIRGRTPPTSPRARSGSHWSWSSPSRSPIAPRHADRTIEVESVGGVLFTPSRPGAVLGEAAARRLPVG